jgi:gliding motility-associated-like protein
MVKGFATYFCFLIMLTFTSYSYAQCPTNIDFENGNFSNWECHAGSVFNNSGNQILLSETGPISNRHQLIERNANMGVVDYYGEFPVACPNGSGYSVKLGNSSGGHQAEGVKYTFTVPAGNNNFSLVYYYAVVFDNPNHIYEEQPRLQIEVRNESDSQLINCSSFTFVPFGSPLPGFFVSPKSDSVYCKDWTPVTINLKNKAGKTISIFFKTADCVYNKHFGYAYVDVNTECSGEFVGAKYCADDTSVTVFGPYGFQGYKWYDHNFSTLLSNTHTLYYNPPPPAGTRIALEVTPYGGYGCTDTLYATMQNNRQLIAQAGADVLLCGSNSSVPLGVNPSEAVIYSWSPPIGLSNSNISNPVATAPVTTQYILSVRSPGGGCAHADTVKITKSLADTNLIVKGNLEYCITSGDSAVLYVNPTQNTQWYFNTAPLPLATSFKYKVPLSGEYYAQVKNIDGCIENTRKVNVNIEKPRPSVTYATEYTVVNDPITLTARNFGNTVSWSPASLLNSSTVYNPVFNSGLVGTYNYSIKITSHAGCLTTDYAQVRVIKQINIYVPTAFTPNGDGLNDLVIPLTEGAAIQNFTIFNRWGQQVYSLAQNPLGWNGEYQRIKQATGTYIWHVQALGINKKQYLRTGTITLLR